MTEKISARTVEQTWQRIARASVSEVPQLINRMRQEQPYVMAYLLATGDALFAPHEKEILFYVGMVVWQMMRQSSGGLQQVGQEELDAAEAANMDFLEQFAQENDANLEMATRAILGTYPEPDVFRYVMEAVMEEDEASGPPIRDEYKGMAFVYLKIVLDAMIASLAEPHQSH